MKIKLLFVAISILLFACTKESNNEVCYQCKDLAGNDISAYCGSSEDDAFSKAKGSTMNGVVITTKTQFLQNCPKR